MPDSPTPAAPDLAADLRRIIAANAGLPESLAERLRGDDSASLGADAATLAAALNVADTATPTPAARTMDGGAHAAPAYHYDLEAARELARTEPGKFCDLVDSGEINIANLRGVR